MAFQSERKSTKEGKIYVIHENSIWMEPLKEAFSKLKMDYEEWNLGNGGTIDMSQAPPTGVFYSRMSASSHTRGHRYAIEHTHAVLEWLELHSRRVVNGSRALLLEQSKVRQYAALEAMGIKTPKTVVVSGDFSENKEEYKAKLISAAKEHFSNIPFISKSNRGGRGIGVRLWRDVSYFEKYFDTEFAREVPVDGILLLQQYIKPPSPYIIRCEFVGAKFLYAVKVNTSEGFELCPADYCSQIQNFKTSFEVIHDFDKHPIISQYEKFLRKNKAEIAGIEFVLDENDEIWTYDVNTNTNYNSTAEKLEFGGMKAMLEIASFLGSELESLRAPSVSYPPSKRKGLGMSLAKTTWNFCNTWTNGLLSRFGETINGIIKEIES